MSPLTASRLARIHMEATTRPVSRRANRRDRKATGRLLMILACIVAPLALRALV